MMNCIYRSGYLVVIKHVVNMQNLPRDCVVIINSYETCRDKEPFPSFRTTETFQGKSRVHQMTVKSTASKY